MTTEGRGAADRNRAQRSLLLMRERISKRRQVRRAVEAENIAQLQRLRFSSTASCVSNVRQSIQRTDGGAHRQVGNVQIFGGGLEIPVA